MPSSVPGPAIELEATKLMIPRKTLLVVGILVVVIVIIAAVAVGFGFLQSPANNPCPAGQCSNQTPPVYFTIVVGGASVNPKFDAPYAVIDTLTASATPGPPGLMLTPPKLDIWNVNYHLDLTYCLTYPNGQAYCAPGAFPSPTPIEGWVGGDQTARYEFRMYHTGPHGTYSVRVTLHFVALGCNSGITCVVRDIPKSATFML